MSVGNGTGLSSAFKFPGTSSSSSSSFSLSRTSEKPVPTTVSSASPAAAGGGGGGVGKGFADVARRLSSSLSAFKINRNSNPNNTSTTASPATATRMSMPSWPTSGMPAAPPSSSSSSAAATPARDMDHRSRSMASPPPSLPKPPVSAAAVAQPANDVDGEEIRERSVKITFPKHGGPVPEAHIRDVVARFGAVVDIGLKDKLAVVLFARSIEALNFACNHGNSLGEDFKVKFMGTKTVPPPGTIFPAPTHTVTDSVEADDATATATPGTAPASSHAPTKAEKAAAAAAAAASLAAAAMNEGASDSQPSVGPAIIRASDGPAPGIGERHRDSKIVHLLDALKQQGGGGEIALVPAPAPVPEPGPVVVTDGAASPTASQAPSPTGGGWKQATRVSTSSPPLPPPAMPPSRASRATLAATDDGTNASDDDDDDVSLSIDMDDLRRDIQSLAPPAPAPAETATTAAAAVGTAAGTTTVRSPSPAEVTVQRSSAKILSSAKMSSRNNQAGVPLGDSGRSDESGGSLLQAVWRQGEGEGADVGVPPRTLTTSPRRRGSDTHAGADGPGSASPPPTATKRASTLKKAATTPDRWPRLSGVYAAPSTGKDNTAAATSALLAVSASMEEELRTLRKKVVLLEAEAKVRNREREDYDREVRSSEQHWAIEMQALVQRASKLEGENAMLKGALQHMKVTAARKDAQLAALEESVNFYQVEVHRHQQREEERVAAGEADRSLPLYPRFLFHAGDPSRPHHATDHSAVSSSVLATAPPTAEKEKPPATALAALRESIDESMAADDDDDEGEGDGEGDGEGEGGGDGGYGRGDMAEESKRDGAAVRAAAADTSRATTAPAAPASAGTRRGGAEKDTSMLGATATTRSLFDDLVATRRQLDDLERLSSQSPSAVRLPSAVKYTRDHARSLSTSTATQAQAQTHISTARSVDVSALVAIARGDFFNTVGVGAADAVPDPIVLERPRLTQSFDASLFNDTMDRIVRLGGPSSTYHTALLEASARKAAYPSGPAPAPMRDDMPPPVTMDDIHALYRPLQLPVYSQATPTKGAAAKKPPTHTQTQPSATMSYYGDFVVKASPTMRQYQR